MVDSFRTPWYAGAGRLQKEVRSVRVVGGIDLSTLRPEQAAAISAAIAEMIAAYDEAVLYGDGSMPDWVKHRIDPLDPRWQGATHDCE